MLVFLVIIVAIGLLVLAVIAISEHDVMQDNADYYVDKYDKAFTYDESGWY